MTLMLFCSIVEEEVDRILDLFNQHCLALGSKMNTQKTKGMWLGRGTPPEWCIKYGFQWVHR
eukprot:c51186_g1_i1 orf=78-263(+)